jgi:hypothetical protein
VFCPIPCPSTTAKPCDCLDLRTNPAPWLSSFYRFGVSRASPVEPSSRGPQSPHHHLPVTRRLRSLHSTCLVHHGPFFLNWLSSRMFLLRPLQTFALRPLILFPLRWFLPPRQLPDPYCPLLNLIPLFPFHLLLPTSLRIPLLRLLPLLLPSSDILISDDISFLTKLTTNLH